METLVRSSSCDSGEGENKSLASASRTDYITTRWRSQKVFNKFVDFYQRCGVYGEEEKPEKKKKY